MLRKGDTAMSRVTDEHLRPHLSALADGELEPLEAVALRHELRANPQLAHEYDEVQRLKLALHLAGSKTSAPPEFGQTLLAQTKAHFAKEQAKSDTWRWVGVALAALALLTVGVLNYPGLVAKPQGLADLEVLHQPDGEQLLSRLVRFHRGIDEASAMKDLVDYGTVLSIERLPNRLLMGKAPKRQVLQASFPRNVESKPSLTLAVVLASHVDLPEEIDEALEAYGAYVEELEGLSIRVSREGDKLYILMSNDSLDALDQSI